MKECILFVHGTYRSKDLPFYKKLCRGKIKIAVNGGCAFFKKTGMRADLIIGDMDSGPLLKTVSRRTSILTFPVRKDKTDSQLAVEYCLKQGAKSIDLVIPSVGDTDHFVANLLLPTSKSFSKWAKTGGRFRVVNKSHEIHYLSDSRVTFNDCKGHTVSVIPVSRQIILTCKGTDYDVAKARVERGHTLALRNRIRHSRAVFDIGGEALIWHFG